MAVKETILGPAPKVRETVIGPVPTEPPALRRPPVSVTPSILPLPSRSRIEPEETELITEKPLHFAVGEPRRKRWFIPREKEIRWTKELPIEKVGKILELPVTALTEFFGGRTFGSDKLLWYAMDKAGVVPEEYSGKTFDEVQREVSPYEKTMTQ